MIHIAIYKRDITLYNAISLLYNIIWNTNKIKHYKNTHICEKLKKNIKEKRCVAARLLIKNIMTIDFNLSF